MENNCPKCGSLARSKAGISWQKQRYKCKDCGCFYTSSSKRGKSDSLKKQALHMYLEGLGFRSIGRILNVSNVSILRWVREAGAKVGQRIESQQAFPTKVAVMELDEMWHFIQKKTTESGCGWLLIETPPSNENGRSEVVTVYQEEGSGKK